MKTVICRRLGERWRHTQQTLEATRGSAPRPSIRHCRRGARYITWIAASGSRSQIRPSVQAVVSLTTTLGSFISSMRVGMACDNTLQVTQSPTHTHTLTGLQRLVALTRHDLKHCKHCIILRAFISGLYLKTSSTAVRKALL